MFHRTKGTRVKSAISVSACMCYCGISQFLIKRHETIAITLDDLNRRITWPEFEQKKVMIGRRDCKWEEAVEGREETQVSSL